MKPPCQPSSERSRRGDAGKPGWDNVDREVRIVDTSLRDGSHAMAHQFTEENVRDTVQARWTRRVCR